MESPFIIIVVYGVHIASKSVPFYLWQFTWNTVKAENISFWMTAVS